MTDLNERIDKVLALQKEFDAAVKFSAEFHQFTTASQEMTSIIRDLQARVKELEARQQWQPIESCPTDKRVGSCGG